MYDLGFGSFDIIAVAVSLLLILLGLWLWFVVNRASVRANEQILLLEAIAEQQRQQTVLLQTLVDYARPVETEAEIAVAKDPADDFLGVVPER